MAGMQPDVVNAALGASFGGPVGSIFNGLINGLKYVYQCPEQCRALGDSLRIFQPSVEAISACYRQTPALKEWLNVSGECVKEAKEVLETCKSESHSIWNRIKEVQYGGEVLKLRDRIDKLIAATSLLHMASKSSSFGITQDVPSKTFGMEDHFAQVKYAILEGHKGEGSSCVGIRGMGGVGKTLLAQMVNNDEEIQEAFGKDSVVWITVGRDASVSEIYKRMRNHLRVRSDGGSLEDERTDLMNAFAAIKVLLILDDVWDGCVCDTKDMVYWLNIAKGSKCVTLITSRDELVTRKCDVMKEEIISWLSERQSWQLFCSHAFDTDTPTLNEDLEVIARDVCKECNGLPLALKVIGCSMKDISDLERMKSNWERILRYLRASRVPNEIVEQQLFGRLRFSYDKLKGPMRICFLYFAGFPEDKEILVELLCRIWMLEGLFGEDLNEEEALGEARYAVKELARRSLIEVSGIGKLERVKMHDVLRDLANQLASEGNECERASLFQMEKKNLLEFPGSWLGINMRVMRLSLWGNKMMRFPNDFLASNLKICMLHGSKWSPIDEHSIGSSLYGCNIGENFFTNLNALKFLQICGNPYIWVLPNSMGGLGSLQHLDLSGCQALEQLPESMEGLGSLQHLDLSGCWTLKQLPESMGGLGSLQYLDLSGCQALEQLPESMGGLGSLQHLDLSRCWTLLQLPECMGGLGSLQHLDLSRCWTLKQLPKSMGGLGSLQHLDLSGCEALEQLPESMGGLRSLQHLDLSGCQALEQLPESMGGLGSLQHLDLSWCEALEQLPENMGGLGSLQHLDLSWCWTLKQLPESMGGLGSLQHLDLSWCEALEQLPESMGGLGSLQHLDLRSCTSIRELPNFTAVDKLKIYCGNYVL